MLLFVYGLRAKAKGSLGNKVLSTPDQVKSKWTMIAFVERHSFKLGRVQMPVMLAFYDI